VDAVTGYAKNGGTPSRIRLSVTVQMRFVDRGEHELRGVPERWQLFALER
jgi:hypothetical protein